MARVRVGVVEETIIFEQVKSVSDLNDPSRGLESSQSLIYLFVTVSFLQLVGTIDPAGG